MKHTSASLSSAPAAMVPPAVVEFPAGVSPSPCATPGKAFFCELPENRVARSPAFIAAGAPLPRPPLLAPPPCLFSPPSFAELSPLPLPRPCPLPRLLPPPLCPSPLVRGDEVGPGCGCVFVPSIALSLSFRYGVSLSSSSVDSLPRGARGIVQCLCSCPICCE
jgi:hypothetical protein